MKARTSKIYANQDLRTEKQWRKEKKVPIDKERGITLWSNGYHYYYYVYYTPEQVRDMNEDELAEYLEELQERKEEERKKRKERRDWERAEKKKIEERKKLQKEYDAKVKEAKMLPSVPCKNDSRIIVIDLEMTGLDLYYLYNNEILYNEILQLSIIDGDGNVLLDSYVKPVENEEWGSTVPIHHITSKTVENAPYLYELIPTIRGIFESADELVFYNAEYDLQFISCYVGITPTNNQKVVDIMDDFAVMYGERDKKYGNFRSKKLTFCAEYFGYDSFEAHNSLNDCRATLFCYCKIKEWKEKGSKHMVDSY